MLPRDRNQPGCASDTAKQTSESPDTRHRDGQDPYCFSNLFEALEFRLESDRRISPATNSVSCRSKRARRRADGQNVCPLSAMRGKKSRARLSKAASCI